MGLSLPALRFLVRLHKEKPFECPVLTLGRQFVYAKYDEILEMLDEEGIRWEGNEPTEEERRTNIPSWQEGEFSTNTSDVAFFKLLGLKDMFALDVSDYEGANFLVDLNAPVSPNLRDRFGLIIDGGTTEHIFDVRQCMMNINMMLKPGGRVVHMAPTSNCIGHGFYCFNPEFYFDYYMANGFVNVQAWIVDQGKDPNRNRWKLYSYRYDSYRGINLSFRSPNPVGTLFIAEKADSSTQDRVPTQGQFRISSAVSPVVVHTGGPLRQIVRRMPLPIYAIARRTYAAVTRLRARTGSNKEVGGLEYLGEI